MVRLSLLTLVLAWKGVSSFTVPPLRSATTASVDSSSIRSSRKSSNNSSSRLYLARRKSSAEDPKDKSDDSAESSAKKAALDGVLNQIERAYGRGSVMRLGDAGQMKVSMISTGSLTLDAATGGGYPRGRVVEIYGPESSGKTTLALHAIAQVQKEGGTAAFIDAEHALDPAYAAGCGVMVDDLLVSQPDSGEMALDVVDQLVRSAAVDVIVVDSVAALVPRAELEGDMSDTQIGLQARLMSKAMRKITGSLALSQCTVIFLNQLRSKVGVIYGSPEVTSGGNALKFYASIRLDTRRKEIMADNAGIRIKVKVVKNKVAAPFKVVMLDVLFGSGVDFWGGMLDAAVELEVVQRRGSWYAYRGENLAQGRPRCIELIKADPKLAEIMEADVRAAMANIGGEANDEPIAPAAVAETGVSEEISAPATASLTEETSYLE
jgi:recombination protein RecA